jgi:hypothetical protein
MAMLTLPEDKKRKKKLLICFLCLVTRISHKIPSLSANMSVQLVCIRLQAEPIFFSFKHEVLTVHSRHLKTQLIAKFSCPDCLFSQKVRKIRIVVTCAEPDRQEGVCICTNTHAQK